MFRNILRTSRWLGRRQINSTALPILSQNITKKVISRNITLGSRPFSSNSQNIQTSDNLEPIVFEKICNETLESLCDYFEELVDSTPILKGADVTFSDGVLTVALGSTYGTYVINRQTPNKQIWLSSPVSGPKRYDLIQKNGGYWIYKHDGVTLHRLLQDEISKIVKEADFKQCSHSLV